MGRRTSRILADEVRNLSRSRWLLVFAGVLLVLTETLLRFDGDTSKTIVSLVNVVVILVPLFAVVLGTSHFYNSREYHELLLTQPIDRTSIYLGRLGGFAASLSLAFLAGVGGPFAVHGLLIGPEAPRLFALLAVGCVFLGVFTAIAFLAAARFEDRLRGLGIVLVAWFAMSVAWDGVILLFIHVFADWPYEPGLLAMIAMNPVDLGRIFVLLQLDVSALMGTTGALVRRTLGSDAGRIACCALLVIHAAVPVAWGLRTFQRRDF